MRYSHQICCMAGSHKPNTAVPQAWYNAQEGVKKLTTETGAGQWGSALAFACSTFGLECEVWQVTLLNPIQTVIWVLTHSCLARVHTS